MAQQDNTSIKLTLPKSKGYVCQDKFAISEDIILMRNHIFANEDILLTKPMGNFNQFCINFNINADAKVSYCSLKEDLFYKNSQMIIGQFVNSSVKMAIKKALSITNISIFLSNNFLEKYLPKFSHLENSQILKIVSLNPKIQHLAQEIYTTKLQSGLEQIYLQGKVFEIISLGLYSLVQSCGEKHKIKFSHYDTKSLHQAREVLQKNYQNPPSITELSKLVRLNEFKLKFGYKQLFGESPYKTVLHKRMLVGKELLMQEDLNITEVAKMVGYKNIQSFTIAFVKYFGLKPRHIKNNHLNTL